MRGPHVCTCATPTLQGTRESSDQAWVWSADCAWCGGWIGWRALFRGGEGDQKARD
jgi:hypothetical protein